MGRLIVLVGLGVFIVSCNMPNAAPSTSATPMAPAIREQSPTPLPTATPNPTIPPIHREQGGLTSSPAIQGGQLISAPAATGTPAIHEQPPTPLPTATPSLPIPPIPQAYLEYGGGLYPGLRGSYCWPMSANSVVCGDSAWWRDFNNTPAVRMNRGDDFKIIVASGDSSPDQEQARLTVFPVVETEPAPQRGEQVYHSTDVEDVHALDLPEGIYFVDVFLKYHAGDVSYGFKVEVVH